MFLWVRGAGCRAAACRATLARGHAQSPDLRAALVGASSLCLLRWLPVSVVLPMDCWVRSVRLLTDVEFRNGSTGWTGRIFLRLFFSPRRSLHHLVSFLTDHQYENFLYILQRTLSVMAALTHEQAPSCKVRDRLAAPCSSHLLSRFLRASHLSQEFSPPFMAIGQHAFSSVSENMTRSSRTLSAPCNAADKRPNASVIRHKKNSQFFSQYALNGI